MKYDNQKSYQVLNIVLLYLNPRQQARLKSTSRHVYKNVLTTPTQSPIYHEVLKYIQDILEEKGANLNHHIDSTVYSLHACVMGSKLRLRIRDYTVEPPISTRLVTCKPDPRHFMNVMYRAIDKNTKISNVLTCFTNNALDVMYLKEY